MRKWSQHWPVDSFPLSYHKAMKDVGVHILKEGLGEGSGEKERQNFSMFRACLRENPRHPLHKFYHLHTTRLTRKNGILWCHTKPNPLINVILEK